MRTPRHAPAADRVAVNIRLDGPLFERVTRHGAALRERAPGVSVSLGDAVRSLLLAGLAAHEKDSPQDALPFPHRAA